MSAPASVSLVLAVLSLAACGGSEPEQGAGASVDLTITVTTPSGTHETALACDPGARSGPCETARRLADFLAREPPRDRICTQIYGGPEKAHVRGTIGDRRIDRRFSKTNGCEIADWERVEPLLSAAQ